MPSSETALLALAFNEFRPVGGHDRVTGNGATRVSFANMDFEREDGSQPPVVHTFTGADAGTATIGPAGSGLGDLRFTGVFAAQGGAGNDSLTGAEGFQQLRGYWGDDTLVGGDGNDLLSGGAGPDQLSGGSGADVFRFEAATDLGTTGAKGDVVTDFRPGIDRIDLRGVDADTGSFGSTDAFTQLLGAGQAFSAAGQLRLDGELLWLNTDTDATAEYAIRLVGVTALSLADFVL